MVGNFDMVYKGMISDEEDVYRWRCGEFFYYSLVNISGDVGITDLTWRFIWKSSALPMVLSSRGKWIEEAFLLMMIFKRDE